MKPEDDVIALATQYLTQKQAPKAVPLLENLVKQMPPDHKAFRETDEEIVVGCWTSDEFVAVAAGYQAKWQKEGVTGKRVTWVRSPYAQALYLLGLAYVELRDLAKAERALTRGLDVDPVQPRFWCELGVLRVHQKNLDGAADCYWKVLGLRGDAKSRAVALRGLGFVHIEKGELDEAEKYYEASLQAEPNNPTAQHELEYIKRLKAGEAPQAPGTFLT